MLIPYVVEQTPRGERGLDIYSRLLQDTCVVPAVAEGNTHVYAQYTIRVARRDELRQHLGARGIPTEIYYPYPLHLQPAFAHLGYQPGSLPVTEAVAQQVVSLPIYPELAEEQLQAVVTSIAEFS